MYKERENKNIYIYISAFIFCYISFGPPYIHICMCEFYGLFIWFLVNHYLITDLSTQVHMWFVPSMFLCKWVRQDWGRWGETLKYTAGHCSHSLQTCMRQPSTSGKSIIQDSELQMKIYPIVRSCVCVHVRVRSCSKKKLNVL